MQYEKKKVIFVVSVIEVQHLNPNPLLCVQLCCLVLSVHCPWAVL